MDQERNPNKNAELSMEPTVLEDYLIQKLPQHD